MDKSTGAQRRLLAEVDWLDSYRPQRIGGDVWLEVRSFVVECAATLGLRDGASARRIMRVLASLAAWVLGDGLPLDVEIVLDPDTVERFVAVGLADDRSRATYRAVLRRVGPRLTRRAPWEPNAPTVARRQVARPYTVDEICGLRDDALAQPTAGRVRAARALLALGAGAGLDGRWVARVTARDIVVWDPGYSLCAPGTTHHKLAQAGIHQTFQIVTHQRGVRPFSGDAVLLDGQLYSSLLPDDLRDLAVPPRGASEAEKLLYEAKFNLRGRWRMVRHAGPDDDGATRWRCPFCAGMLRSRAFPTTMRGAKTVPLVPTAEGCEKCCSGILTAMPVELPWWQRIPFGTTAWRLSMGRRQVVESANAALKGTFADLNRGFFRVFGRTKMTVLLGFTIAGYNLDRIRSFRAKQRALAEAKPKPAKRRQGTWKDIVEPTATPSEGTDGPPG